MKKELKHDQVQFSQDLRHEIREANQRTQDISKDLRQELWEANQNTAEFQKAMTEAMCNLISNMKPGEAVSQQPPSLIHPPTSKRSRDTSTLTQNYN